MRFLFYSTAGDIAFMVRRVLDEGHEAELYVKDPSAKDIGRGLIPLTDSPIPRAGTTVVFDGPGHGNLGQAFRRRGLGVIGGNPVDTDLELNRTKGTRLMRQYGIATPQTYSFSSITQAKAFLATHRGEFFVKFSGNLATALTSSGQSDELIRFLDWASEHVRGAASLELQRPVEGTEVSCELFFDGERVVGPLTITIEEKHFLTGSLGPRVGCASNVVTALADRVPRMAQLSILRMVPYLREHRYVGALDINCMYDADGVPFGLEFSARWGFDATQAWSMLLGGNLGEQLTAFANGDLRSWDLRQDEMAMTLRLSVPPYPTESPSAARKQQGFPLDAKLLEKPEATFLDDIMIDDEGLPVLAGRDGAIGCIGVTGRSLPTMRQQLLKRAKEYDIPQFQYRTDPVSRAEEAFAALRGFGYLTSRDVPGIGRVSHPSASPPSTARDEGANPSPEDEAVHAPHVVDTGESL